MRLSSLLVPGIAALLASSAQAQAIGIRSPDGQVQVIQMPPPGMHSPMLGRGGMHPGMGMGAAYPSMGATYPGMGGAAPSVKKLSDSEATCSDLYAEARQLEQRIEQTNAKAMAAETAMQQATDEMMRSSSPGGGAQALSTASSLLSMVPGVGLAAGLATDVISTAAAGAAATQAQEQSTRMMKAQQDMMQISQDSGRDQARYDYVVELFLNRGCKASQSATAAPADTRSSAAAAPRAAQGGGTAPEDEESPLKK